MTDHDPLVELTRIFEDHDRTVALLSRRSQMGGALALRGELPQLPSILALPTAAQEYRGRMVIVRGDGSTTNDIAYVCRLLSTGSYVWTAMGNIGGPPSGPWEFFYGELEGFAKQAGFVGGKDQTIKTVTNNNDSGAGSYREAATNGAAFVVFDADYTIDFSTSILPSNNVTSAGMSEDGTLRNIQFKSDGGPDTAFLLLNGTEQGVYNIDFGEFTKYADPENDWIDDDSIKNALRFGSGGTGPYWLHHCTWASDLVDNETIAAGGTANAFRATVSWCKWTTGNSGGFNTSEHVGLHSNPAGTAGQRITYHHCHMDSQNRQPRMGNANRAHLFNNYRRWRSQGVELRNDTGTHILSENEIYDAANAGVDEEKGVVNEGGNSKSKVTGQLLQNGATGPDEQDAANVDVFTGPASEDWTYSYVLDPTSGLETDLSANAGART